MVLVKNVKSLHPFFFGQIASEVFGTVLDRSIHQFEKLENPTFFLRSLSMVLVKSLKFLHLFCFGQHHGKKKKVFGAF